MRAITTPRNASSETRRCVAGMGSCAGAAMLLLLRSHRGRADQASFFGDAAYLQVVSVGRRSVKALVGGLVDVTGIPGVDPGAETALLQSVFDGIGVKGLDAERDVIDADVARLR